MKLSSMIATGALALALAACGKSGDSTSQATATGDVAQATMPPAEPVVSAGQTFADAAASSDAFEIETSKLAAEKATSAKVKSFAQTMIKAHTQSTEKLMAAAAAASPAIMPAAQMDAAQRVALADLKGKTGAAFDTAYIEAQAEGHQRTLDALKAYAASGDVPSLKSFATQMVPTVTAHLNMARGM